MKILAQSLHRDSEAFAWKCSMEKHLSQMFFKISVLKNFAVFKGKHLC